MSDSLKTPDSALRTERLFSASCPELFAAFEKPESLATWWGPEGFTNTFTRFEFRVGGRWVFVMHGPNGVNFPNKCVFREIAPHAKIVIEHVVPPWFRLTVELTPVGQQTKLAWTQQFETPEIAEQLRPICDPANEQNLDRLEVVLGLRTGNPS